jgi:nicotinamide-nucleotide amidase
MTKHDTAEEAQHLLDLLQSNDLGLVTAESCTAGLISCTLSKAKGAAERLHGGFVVYTKAHKHAALGIDPALLDEVGAVNATIAEQMARGAIERSDADVAVAATGVAGPEPDEDGNPVGKLILAFAVRDGQSVIEEHNLQRMTAEQFRDKAVGLAINLVTRALQSPQVHEEIEAMRAEATLDHALKETFPASDPISIVVDQASPSGGAASP